MLGRCASTWAYSEKTSFGSNVVMQIDMKYMQLGPTHVDTFVAFSTRIAWWRCRQLNKPIFALTITLVFYICMSSFGPIC